MDWYGFEMILKWFQYGFECLASFRYGLAIDLDWLGTISHAVNVLQKYTNNVQYMKQIIHGKMFIYIYIYVYVYILTSVFR